MMESRYPPLRCEHATIQTTEKTEYNTALPIEVLEILVVSLSRNRLWETFTLNPNRNSSGAIKCSRLCFNEIITLVSIFDRPGTFQW